MKGGRVVRSTNCVDYLNIAIENIDSSIRVDKMALNNYGNLHRPYSSIFKMELDVTEDMG